MARAKIKTWLSLDRWAEIIGLHPLHFNQLQHTSIQNTVCGDVWFQYSYQHSDRVGREDIAMAIQTAEQNIAAEVGFNLIPDWTAEERLTYPHPAMPGTYNLFGTNIAGILKSVELRRGWVISGGVKAKTLIQAGATFVRSDDDTDGFQETCTLDVATTVTDVNEIRLYYPAKNGAEGWEIRPISVTISGGTARIVFKIWQVAAANQIDNITNINVLNAALATSYESTVDVYRVYNDPSTQVQFMWENNAGVDCCGSCVACQFSTQAGCFHLRDDRLGLAVPAPATWDSADEEFDEGEWSACREPDQIRFWYYSGYRNMDLDRPYVQMDPFWEYAVAYYAASLLDRPVCGCSNVQQFIDKWRMDIMVQDSEDISFTTTPEMLSNKLGTTIGALYAWKRIRQNGKRIVK